MTSTKQSFWERLARLHPHQTFVYLTLVGIGLVFLFLVLAFVSFQSGKIVGVFPKSFYLSTLLLLMSSAILARSVRLLEAEDLKGLSRILQSTLVLGGLFCLTQALGWKELNESGLLLSGKAAVSLLYLISGVHLVHIVGGMFFLIYEAWQIHLAAHDAVKELITITNPYQKIRLNLLGLYWHFMDAIWLFLFCMFYFSF